MYKQQSPQVLEALKDVSIIQSTESSNRIEGSAPPEDVGGISGYIEFLNIISNPEHKEYRNMREWFQSQRYREFDIDLVNIRLKNILRFPVVV